MELSITIILGHDSRYLRQLFDEVVDVGCFSSCLYFLHRHSAAVVSIGYVFSQGAVKQYRLLGHDTYLGPQPLDVQLFYIHTVQHLVEKIRAEISWWVHEYCQK